MHCRAGPGGMMARRPAPPEPVDWFPVAVGAFEFQTTGSMDALGAALARAPAPPAAVRELLADALIARALAAAFDQAYAVEQARPRRRGAPAPRDRAADAVTLTEPFFRLGLTRAAVHAAVALARKPARKTPP